MTTERTVDAGGGRLVKVLEAGDPDGAPVFVHHGTPFSRVIHAGWDADAAGRGIRLISYDRPGYGGSDRLSGRSVADAVPDVTAIADALGIDWLASWGWSGGGPYALACAALLPDRVIAVAAVSSLAPYGSPGLDFLRGMGEGNAQALRLSLEDPDALGNALMESRPEMLAAEPEDLQRTFGSVLSEVDRGVLGGALAHYMHESMRVAVESGIDGWLDDQLALVKPWGFSLETVRCPVLVWHGRQDRMVPVSHGEWLAERLPQCEARLPADDGHLTLVSDRVGEIHAWLRAV